MARAKTPDFFKTYNIYCEGRGLTKEYALYLHKLDVKYQKRWIRGEAVDGEVVLVEGLNGDYVASSTITFFDRKHLNESGIHNRGDSGGMLHTDLDA